MLRYALIFLLAAACAGAARSEQFYNEPIIIDDNLCVGNGCVAGQVFPVEPLMLALANPRIRIKDTSATTHPHYDWELVFNDDNSIANGGVHHFTVRNIHTGNNIFSMRGGAPENSLHIDNTGAVGIGTGLPQGNLHISDGGEPTLWFERNGSHGFDPKQWKLTGFHSFELKDPDNSTTPIKITPGPSNNWAISVSGGGYVGHGTPYPRAALHLTRFDGQTRMLIEELDSTISPRTMIELKNTGRPEIVLANTSTDGEWSFGAGTNFVLKQGAVGTASSEKTKLFEIQPNGDAVLTGSLTTGGPSCAAGCDAVFSDDYDLPSISEHAEAMFSLGHLPNVGPTVPGAPINMSEQLGRLLNELEHAHIYIARLEADKAAMNARLHKVESRLEALTAALPPRD